jgi:dipeptidyl aminopeptidase/acylaminoacyl peptidase
MGNWQFQLTMATLLPNRHWDAYVTEKKNNIFVVDLAIIDRRYKVSSEPINLLRKTGLESPGLSQGDASDFDISADASQIAFVSKSTKKDSAWQSSAHVYIVSTSGKEEPIAINKYIPAASSSPHFTSSGLLVYFQMLTPQYEADRNRIVVYNPKTQEQKTIAESWDSSPHEVASSADSKFLYVTAEQQGRNKIFRIDLETESVEALTGEKYAAGLKVLPSGNIFYGVSSMNHPVSPHVLDVSTKEIYPLAIESGLAKKLESIDLADPEEIKFTGALEQEVHGWYLKPANYRKGERYPVVVMIHGGPRSAESDSW